MTIVNKVKYSNNKVVRYAFLIRNVVGACENIIERGKNWLEVLSLTNVQRKDEK